MKQDKLKLRNETNSAEALDDPASQRGRGSDANQRACKKKFVDLSSSPPPPFWLTAYAQGVVFPRILTVYSADDVNLIYYDYAPQLRVSCISLFLMQIFYEFINMCTNKRLLSFNRIVSKET